MRERIESRPLWICALAFSLGVICHVEVSGWAVAILGLAMLRRWISRGLLSAWLVAGFCAMASLQVEPILETAPFRGSVTLISPPVSYDWGWSADVSSKLGRLRLTSSGPEYSLGDQIECSGKITPLSESRRANLANLPTRANLRVESAQLLQPGPAMVSWASSWRENLSRSARESLSPSAADLLLAVCFNQDQHLDVKQYQELSRTGVVHLVSASGVHVAVLAAAILGILRLLCIPRLGSLSVLVFGLGLFTLAAGLEAPIIRSFTFAIVYLFAYVVRRNPDLFQALGVAFFLEILRRPNAVFDVGVQLSYGTVAAMILFGPQETETEIPMLKQWLIRVRAAFQLSAVAWLGSLPLVAYHFGTVPLLAVPMNLAVAAMASPLLMVGLIVGVVGNLNPSLADWLLRTFAEPLASGISSMAASGSELGWAVLVVGPFSVWWVVAIYGLILARWKVVPRQV